MSKRYRLDSIDWKKVGVGAFVAVLGVLLTYGSEFVSNTDFGEYEAFVVAGFSILTNLVRKFFSQTK